MKAILVSTFLAAGLLTDGFISTFSHFPYSNRMTQDHEINFSGEWIDNNEKIWVIYKSKDEIDMIREDQGCRLKGTLVGNRIKYKTYIQFCFGAPKEECKQYIGVPIPYDAELVISEDDNKIENKVPETESKGECVIDLKILPPFSLIRVKPL
jgi:hypothetical protein